MRTHGKKINTMNIRASATIITRGSAIAERPARRSMSVDMLLAVVRMTQTDRVSTWGALSVTVTFCSATAQFYTLNATIGSAIVKRACDTYL